MDRHGDEQSGATRIEPSHSPSGRIQIPSDRDWFLATLPVGAHRISVRDGVHLLVVDADGEEIPHEQVGSSIAFTLDSEQDVYFEVSANTYDKSYKVSIEFITDDHGDSIARATSITELDASISGQFEFSDDVDFFSFSVRSWFQNSCDHTQGLNLAE